MSPKLSSLAVEDLEHIHGHDALIVEPQLYVVEPRRNARTTVLAPMSSLEEVVLIAGQFTVSF
ncbi:MAG: hypothetical protein H0X51_04520 [Parachlamydiaceae bacterium]|nr:hypothetical protein [Parachlamydiaceae bacterium]